LKTEPWKCDLTTSSEVMQALAAGLHVICQCTKREPMMTSPMHVVRCQGNRVLVRHWSDFWIVVGDPSFRLVTFTPLPKPTFREWAEANSIEVPHAGVNRPAGDSWGIAGEMGHLVRRYRREVGEP